MPAFTIVTTTASEGSDATEVNLLADDFANESEALGYSRRMAEEVVGLAAQLLLDFDYSNVGVYEGDRLDEDLNPEHPSFIGMWVLDHDGAAYVPADEFSADVVEG